MRKLVNPKRRLVQNKTIVLQVHTITNARNVIVVCTGFLLGVPLSMVLIALIHALRSTMINDLYNYVS